MFQLDIPQERGETYIKQLMGSSLTLPQVKVKFLGSTGVGKSTLIETLKCGLFSSFFRRSRFSSSSSTSPTQSLFSQATGGRSSSKNGNFLTHYSTGHYYIDEIFSFGAVLLRFRLI